MNIGAILVSTLFTLGRTLFSEKVLLNLVVLLADWAAKKTTNDLDDKIVKELKGGLDKRQGSPVNLYQSIKSKNP
jgi:hypothetical protein